MRQYINMVLTLFFTTFIASLILSCVYRTTRPKIDSTQKMLLELTLREVIEADSFISIIPDTIYNALSGSDTVGIVFRIFPQGYGGPIPITVGLNRQNMVTAIKVASPGEGLKETPGLGSKIVEPSFIEQFSNQDSNAIRLRKEGGKIDGITGATISSKAVTDGVRKGIEYYSKYLNKVDPRTGIFSAASEFSPIVNDSAWLAFDQKGQRLGLVFITSTPGFCSTIKIVAGIDINRKIAGVIIIEQQETEGIGTCICEQSFLKQFTTQREFETVSGATISSKAVINAVKNGLAKYQVYLE